MPSNLVLGNLVTFLCHDGNAVDARVREVHVDGTLDLEVLVSDQVTINKRKVRAGEQPGCWRERAPELVDAEEVSQ